MEIHVNSKGHTIVAKREGNKVKTTVSPSILDFGKRKSKETVYFSDSFNDANLLIDWIIEHLNK